MQKIRDNDEEEKDFSNNIGARFIKKLFPVVDFRDARFFTIENGKKVATMLLVVVAVIEVSDLIFALDSIPAIFTISDDVLNSFADKVI